MIRRATAALLALALPLVSAPGASTVPPHALDGVIARASFEGVAIAGDADRPSLVKTTGFAAKGVPNRASATWRWASVTKQITATIVMQEVAAGRLDLDKPVTTWWPDWPQVFSDRITLRELLQHNSGLADPNTASPPGKDGLPAFYRPAPGQGTMAYEATHFCAEHPRAEPGTGFQYNNCDFILLGVLLERVTGKSYAQLVQERIARPLGLRIGLFDPDRPAPPHVRGLDDKGRPEVIGNLGTYGAAGSLHGSPLALYAVDRALLTGKLLGPTPLGQMWTGEPKLSFVALGQWQFTAPLKGCATPVSIVQRDGEIGGVQVRNFIVPASKRSLVLFTRAGGFEYGEVWTGKGFAFEALSIVECGR